MLAEKTQLETRFGPPIALPERKNLLGGLHVERVLSSPNIHPYTECMKRQQTVSDYATDIGLKMIYQEGYDLEKFLRNVAFRESDRCLYCYHDRLRTTALMAKRGRFDYYSTTLLYSKFQKHERIKSIGESIGKSIGVPFYYHDFRQGWKAGVEKSKQLGMYRQPYCGCIYSEKERYFKG